MWKKKNLLFHSLYYKLMRPTLTPVLHLTYLQIVCKLFHIEISTFSARTYAGKINIWACISIMQSLLVMMSTQPALSDLALKVPHV